MGRLLRRDARAVVVVACVLLPAAGCKDPFSLREPPPGGGVGGTWATPSTPEQCLINLQFSVNERVVSNYATTLAEGFAFSAPSDSAASPTPSLYADWDHSVEMAVATALLGLDPDSSAISLQMTEVFDRPDVIGDTTAALVRDYELLVVTAASGSYDTVRAQGVSVFELVVDEVTLWWVIRLWTDEGDPQYPTSWADVKIAYR